MTIQPELVDSVDVAFIALPHKAAAAAVPPLLANGSKVVDISADFRLHDRATYEQWYDVTHPCSELLDEAIYGLPELHRAAIREARLVANPGCYPTASILALAPVAKLVEGTVIVDAKSGVSGAGRSLSIKTHYSEVNESVAAYSVDGHRHLPEITQEIGELQSGRAGTAAPNVVFLPHLIPMTRGILASCYATLREPISAASLRELYRTSTAIIPLSESSRHHPPRRKPWEATSA